MIKCNKNDIYFRSIKQSTNKKKDANQDAVFVLNYSTFIHHSNERRSQQQNVLVWISPLRVLE